MRFRLLCFVKSICWTKAQGIAQTHDLQRGTLCPTALQNKPFLNPCGGSVEELSSECLHVTAVGPSLALVRVCFQPSLPRTSPKVCPQRTSRRGIEGPEHHQPEQTKNNTTLPFESNDSDTGEQRGSHEASTTKAQTATPPMRQQSTKMRQRLRGHSGTAKHEQQSSNETALTGTKNTKPQRKKGRSVNGGSPKMRQRPCENNGSATRKQRSVGDGNTRKTHT